jgi:chromosome segregation ATPase
MGSTGSNRTGEVPVHTASARNVEELRDRIQDINRHIDETVVDLDQKLDLVLENNEKDFLMAYRFHMLKVQNELMLLKKKAGETELKAIQDSKLAELDLQVRAIQSQCMESRRECDDQESRIKKLNFEKQIRIDEAKFLDYELRDGKEQNASLKLNLSKQLTKLDEQNFENEHARQQLHQFIFDFNQSIQFDGNLSPIGRTLGSDSQLLLNAMHH